MLIDESKKVIKGTHKGSQFRVDGGILHYRGLSWDQNSVKILIELCNLLKLEGHKLIEKLPEKKGDRATWAEAQFMWPFLPSFDDEEGE